MKKFLAVAAISFCVLSDGKTQTVNDVPIKELDVDYVQIVGSSKLFSNKINVDIDFGQENKVFTNKDPRIKDADGKNITFNSMINALNFMVKNGFEFVQTYAFSTGNSGNVYHYLHRKKK